MRRAWIFAFAAMGTAFIFAICIGAITQNFYPIILLVISAFFISLYDLTSKKYPFTDVFVALGIFFLILYGSSTVDLQISNVAWIVCVLGCIQVLFMQIVAGGMKDIENDFKKGANTLAIRMGVRIKDGKLKVSAGFKSLAYGIQLVDMVVVFLPFFVIAGFGTSLRYFQWPILIIIGGLMFFLSHRLLSMERFERFKARKFIGSHYVTNFALVPIMLMSLNPWAGLIVFFPALGYILSNIILHGTILQPKTM
jgi:4-hydroxybenzoate polyprenyltransferase